METIARWTKDGLGFEATTSTGHLIGMDSSKDHGGSDAGPRPVELLLVALAGCTGMDVIAILQKKRQKVSAFSIRVEGDRREEHPRSFTQIRVTYEVAGEGIDPAAVRQAVALSEEKYCSVAAMLRLAAPITAEIRVTESTS
jgi:putative redox protein